MAQGGWPAGGIDFFKNITQVCSFCDATKGGLALRLFLQAT